MGKATESNDSLSFSQCHIRGTLVALTLYKCMEAMSRVVLSQTRFVSFVLHLGERSREWRLSFGVWDPPWSAFGVLEISAPLRSLPCQKPFSHSRTVGVAFVCVVRIMRW